MHHTLPMTSVITGTDGDEILHKGRDFGLHFELQRPPFARLSEIVAAYPATLHLDGAEIQFETLRQRVADGGDLPQSLQFRIFLPVPPVPRLDRSEHAVAELDVRLMPMRHNAAVLWIFEWVRKPPELLAAEFWKGRRDPITSVTAGPYRFTTWRSDMCGTGSFELSRQCEQIIGITQEQIDEDPGKIWAQVHPDDIEEMSLIQARALEENLPFKARMRMTVGDKTKLIYAESVPVEMLPDKIIWEGMMIDITAYQIERQREEVGHARDVFEARNVGELVERERMIGELHDGLGSLLLEAKHKLRQPDVSPAAISPLIEESVNELRLIVMTAEYSNRPFAEAFRELCGRLQGSFQTDNLKIVTKVELGDDIPIERWAVNVLRIVQELVANAVKHSGASLVEIVAQHTPEGQLDINVRDNGSGFSQALERRRGYGLLSIQKRADAMNADFDIKTGPEGSCMRLTLRVGAKHL